MTENENHKKQVMKRKRHWCAAQKNDCLYWRCGWKEANQRRHKKCRQGKCILLTSLFID